MPNGTYGGVRGRLISPYSIYSALGGAASLKRGRSPKTEDTIRHFSDGKLPLCIYKELVLILGLSPNPYI